MLNATTRTERIYETRMGRITLHEEERIIYLKMYKTDTGDPEKLRGFIAALKDAADRMEAK